MEQVHGDLGSTQDVFLRIVLLTVFIDTNTCMYTGWLGGGIVVRILVPLICQSGALSNGV